MLLLRILINLYFKLWRVLYFPLILLRKRAFGFLVLGGIIYLLVTLYGGDSDDQEHASSRGSRTAQPGKSLIQPIKRVEDGNSAFSSDLLPSMNEEELKYYSDMFYMVMDTQPSGNPYRWSYFNIHGSLTPGDTFSNKLGDQCRRFTELLKVHETQQSMEGIACEDHGGAWCKLGKNWTPACGLGRKQGIGSWWSDTKRSIGNLF